jgi:hypothetical protein
MKKFTRPCAARAPIEQRQCTGACFLDVHCEDLGGLLHWSRLSGSGVRVCAVLSALDPRQGRFLTSSKRGSKCISP